MRAPVGRRCVSPGLLFSQEAQPECEGHMPLECGRQMAKPCTRSSLLKLTHGFCCVERANESAQRARGKVLAVTQQQAIHQSSYEPRQQGFAWAAEGQGWNHLQESSRWWGFPITSRVCPISYRPTKGGLCCLTHTMTTCFS